MGDERKKPDHVYDVLVVGGGPGGASTAIRLSATGLRVAVLERLDFPRPHIGICLSDQTLTLLEYLGLRDQFHAAGFWRRRLTAVSWGCAEIRTVPQTGFHVDRGVLDQLMLRAAHHAGAAVYQPAAVLGAWRAAEDGWRVTVDHGGARKQLTARFIVDAAGRRRALPGPSVQDGPSLVALHASWELENAPPFDGLIQSGENSWLWYARTAPRRAVVSVFVDPRRHELKTAGELQASYTRLLEECRVLQPRFLARQFARPRICDATARHAGDPIGDQHVRVGDACLSVDPLSSQGVHLALQTGVQAAVITNTVLRKPQNAALARQFFENRLDERVRRYTQRTREEYRRVAAVRAEPFWHERAEGAGTVEPDVHSASSEPPPARRATRVSRSPEATIEEAPVIDGLFVEARQVLRHPNLEGPVAYVDGINLVDLLSMLPETFSYQELGTHWRERVPGATGRKIASWLWNKRILVDAS